METKVKQETKTKWTSVQDLFAATAERFPERVAIECAGRRVTYRELEGRANRLANFFIARGAAQGSVIAIVAEDVGSIVAAILGSLKAGGVFAPVDPALPQKRIETILALAAPGWIVAESRFAPIIEATTRELTGAPKLILLDGDAPQEAGGRLIHLTDYADFHEVSRPSSISQPDDMCSIYFTSGSTGRPKGIAGRLKGIDHFVRWEIKMVCAREGTRVSQLTSPSFDGFLKDVFVPLCAGGTVCAPPSRDLIMDGRRLVNWIDAERLNVLHCVPSVFRAIINERLSPDLFTDLRYVVLAGEPLLPSDVARWTEIFSDRAQIINLYGPTETTVTKLFYLVKPTDGARRTIPIGKPMEGAAAIIMDSKGRPCPPGAIGEIYIRTPFRAHGYHRQPELTAEAFIRNPFNDDPFDLIYRTGDFGRVAEDGNLEFLGRRDQQVKIRGVRIELGEIEDALRRHPSVADVAVVDREDTSGNKYLCAYFAAKSAASASDLRRFLSDSLPQYMLPSAFVEMESLPRTFNGKLDRRALPSPEQARASAARGGYVATRNEVEEVLAGVWSKTLGMPRVSVVDNFFELGGHSLLATQVLTRIRDAFGIELPIHHFFDAPTIDQLAAKVDEAIKAGRTGAIPPLARAPRDGAAPLSFPQRRMWLLNELDPDNPSYNIHTGLRLEGALNRLAYEQALDEIARRHESLRAIFPAVDGAPRQVITRVAPQPPVEVDLTELPAATRERLVTRLRTEEARRAFDLKRGPLARSRLLRIAQRETFALFTMHHIISDGWSLGVLERELAGIYDAFAAGRPSTLAELEIQYVDYAVWQNAWLVGDALEEKLAYWRRQLADPPTDLRLPADHRRGSSPIPPGANHSFELGADAREGLGDLARREGATLFMALLAGFKALLHRYTGQDDIIVGSPVANRARAETEGLIGCFINTLALRTNLTGNPTFRELLARVRETALAAYAHQDAPYELVVEAAHAERAQARRAPLFRVWFVLQNAPLGELPLRDVRVAARGADLGAALFDLTLMMWDTPDGLRATLNYNREMFEPDTAAELAAAFQTLLAEAVKDPDRPVLDLRLRDGAPPATAGTDAEREDQFVL